MNDVHLIRIDPARNVPRFYRLDVQPDLFGGFAVVKEWGRIGARGPMVGDRDDQRVAFEMADGIAMPGRGHLRRMRFVEVNVADFVIFVEHHRDLVRLLQHE